MFLVGVISMQHIEELISFKIEHNVLISRIREYAHLVRGVWVIKSELAFPEDEYSLQRIVRDFALCLLNANLPVRR